MPEDECTFCSFISDIGSFWRSDNAIDGGPRFSDHFKTGSNVSDNVNEFNG